MDRRIMLQRAASVLLADIARHHAENLILFCTMKAFKYQSLLLHISRVPRAKVNGD